LNVSIQIDVLIKKHEMMVSKCLRDYHKRFVEFVLMVHFNFLPGCFTSLLIINPQNGDCDDLSAANFFSNSFNFAYSIVSSPTFLLVQANISTSLVHTNYLANSIQLHSA